jgi:nucleotide-binding universal stress UspA family protein
MKILVCADGSEHSQKALEKASVLAERAKIEAVSIIHVYEGNLELPHYEASGGKGYVVTDADLKYISDQYVMKREKGERILQQALKVFQEKNIAARTILKQGHISHTIVTVAAEEGYDLIFIGNRGLGGLKKIFLGSVSSAVVQEVEDCSVVIVK